MNNVDTLHPEAGRTTIDRLEALEKERRSHLDYAVALEKEQAALWHERRAANEVTGAIGRGFDQCEIRAPKPWVELTIEEKLERTRERVKSAEQALNYQNDTIRRQNRTILALRALLDCHQHAPLGGILVPPHVGDVAETARDRDYPDCPKSAQERPELAYF